MNYWPEYLLTIQIQTALVGIGVVALILIAVSSIKRTRLLESKKKPEMLFKWEPPIHQNCRSTITKYPTIETASGEELDQLAEHHGIYRKLIHPRETDAQLRDRVLAGILKRP